MTTSADPRSATRDSLVQRMGRISWSGPGDPPTPSDALREYAARLESEAVRVRKRAEEIEDTLAIIRECLAAMPTPPPVVEEPDAHGQHVPEAPDRGEAPVAVVRRADPESPPVPPIRAWLLGDFRIAVGARVVRPRASTKVWRLLKFLVSRGGGPVAVDVLADTFWRTSSPPAALQSVYSAAHTLRRTLAELGGANYVTSQAGFYSLAPGAQVSTDVAFFSKEVEASARARARGLDEDARTHLEAAVAAYRGRYLPAEPYERWAADEREALATVFLRALETLARLSDAAGMRERTVELHLRILREDPLRERSHESLIRHYLGAGRRALAVRQYRSLEATLAEELGISPEPNVRALLGDLLEDRGRTV